MFLVFPEAKLLARLLFFRPPLGAQRGVPPAPPFLRRGPYIPQVPRAAGLPASQPTPDPGRNTAARPFFSFPAPLILAPMKLAGPRYSCSLGPAAALIMISTNAPSLPKCPTVRAALLPCPLFWRQPVHQVPAAPATPRARRPRFALPIVCFWKHHAAACILLKFPPVWFCPGAPAPPHPTWSVLQPAKTAPPPPKSCISPRLPRGAGLFISVECLPFPLPPAFWPVLAGGAHFSSQYPPM